MVRSHSPMVMGLVSIWGCLGIVLSVSLRIGGSIVSVIAIVILIIVLIISLIIIPVIILILLIIGVLGLSLSLSLILGLLIGVLILGLIPCVSLLFPLASCALLVYICIGICVNRLLRLLAVIFRCIVKIIFHGNALLLLICHNSIILPGQMQ